MTHIETCLQFLSVNGENDLVTNARAELGQLREQFSALSGALKQEESNNLNLRAFIQELESVHQATLNELEAEKAECVRLRERLDVQQGTPSVFKP